MKDVLQTLHVSNCEHPFNLVTKMKIFTVHVSKIHLICVFVLVREMQSLQLDLFLLLKGFITALKFVYLTYTIILDYKSVGLGFFFLAHFVSDLKCSAFRREKLT